MQCAEKPAARTDPPALKNSHLARSSHSRCAFFEMLLMRTIGVSPIADCTIHTQSQQPATNTKIHAWAVDDCVLDGQATQTVATHDKLLGLRIGRVNSTRLVCTHQDVGQHLQRRRGERVLVLGGRHRLVFCFKSVERGIGSLLAPERNGERARSDVSSV